jgi:asparagine synthase (glutamine-hydrolysing)
MTEQPLVTCVHYYTATRRPEESPWAKLVAEHFGLDILCHACEVHVPIEALLRMAPMVSPPPDYSWALAGDYEREAAAFTKATAIMTGDGGDPAFGRYSEDFACIDFLKQRGLGRGILALAADVALLRNRSAWSVLAEALTHDPTAIRLEDARRIRNGRTLVSDDVFEAAHTAVRSHPWFKSIGRSSVSDTLETVTQADLFYDPLRPATEIDLEPLHPLCSQPVIETCLRIPSYVRMQGGRSRGLARKAFQSDLPPQIYSRRWKDAGQGSAYELMRKSGAAIREFLLEGVLIQNHLLDRRRVEESLSATPGKHAAVVHELADHVIVEAWLRTAERVGFGPGASVCV